MAEHGGDIYRNNVEMDFSVNVSPYGVPAAVRAALTKSLLQVSTYPDTEYEELRNEIAKLENCNPDHIVCGNGVSELLYVITNAVMNQEKEKKRVGLLQPCFSEYKKAALAANVSLFNEVIMREENAFVPLKEDIVDLFFDAGLVILGNPNNPTGRLLEKEWLLQAIHVAKEQDGYIILDESFLSLSQRNLEMEDIKEQKLIRLHSFTKSMAIPGIRIGYAIIEDLALLQKVKALLPEWNVSVPAVYAGIAASRCQTWLKEQVEDERTGLDAKRKYFCNLLEQIGITVFDSDTNFLLIKSEKDLYSYLLEQGILIRKCDNFIGLDDTYYRIAIRSREENECLVKALQGENKTNGTVKQSTKELLHVKPEDIESTSFSIITQELEGKGIHLKGDQASIIKRCIHTTADFEYVHTLQFSENAVSKIKSLILEGAHIITDTNMSLSGINKRELAKYGGEVHCFMADAEVSKEAKERGVTRATVSMEKAADLLGKKIFVVGNAPTALVTLCEMMQKDQFKPDFVIGVPVGFVNVEPAKEMVMEMGVPFIVNRGRKGGSNVAAAICNGILYQMREE